MLRTLILLCIVLHVLKKRARVCKFITSWIVILNCSFHYFQLLQWDLLKIIFSFWLLFFEILTLVLRINRWFFLILWRNNSNFIDILIRSSLWVIPIHRRIVLPSVQRCLCLYWGLLNIRFNGLVITEDAHCTLLRFCAWWLVVSRRNSGFKIFNIIWRLRSHYI